MPRKTNTELITDLMDFAKSGPLMQAFILDALTKHARKCVEAGPTAFESPMLSGKAWHRCAVEVQAALAEHLAP